MENLRSKKAKWCTLLAGSSLLLVVAISGYAGNTVQAATAELSPVASATVRTGTIQRQSSQAVSQGTPAAKESVAIPAIRTLTALYKPENAQKVLDELTRNHPGVEFKIIADGSIVRADTCQVIYVSSATAQAPFGTTAAGCTPTQAQSGQGVPGGTSAAKVGARMPAIRTLTALYKPENAQKVLDELTRSHPGVEFKIIADGSIVRADTCEVIYVTSAAAQVPGGTIAAGCTPTQMP
jgi:guanyl-specific ribonuclease Sa